jgi:hypothetical protein
MARGMERHKNQKFVTGTRSDHRMLHGTRAKIFRIAFNVSNRAAALFAEVVKSFRERRKGTDGMGSIRRHHSLVAIDGVANKTFFTAAICGDTLWKHLRRQHSEHAVLGAAHMFDAF